MIVLDASALMAIIQGEPEASACREAIEAHDDLLISAATLTETLIAAAARQLHSEMNLLVSNLALTILPLTEARAHDAVRAYMSWGKGFHAAKLNFGDCFAYALAREQDCPLLFVGEDFAGTDIEPAIR